MSEEKVVAAASVPSRVSADDLVRVIRAAGSTPARQRTDDFPVEMSVEPQS